MSAEHPENPMDSGQPPPDDERLLRAEKLGADAIDKLWKQTEELDQYFNVEALRKEQIPAVAEAHRTQSEGYYQAILNSSSSEIQSEAAPFWRETEIAFQDIQSATTDQEAQRALKIILLNNVKLSGLRDRLAGA